MLESQMEKKMENEMETGIYRGLKGLGFPKIRGTILGVPIIVRVIVFWGSILRSPYLGKLPYRSQPPGRH